MLNQDNFKSKGLGDIVDFQRSDRFSLSEFRRKQDKLVKAGFKRLSLDAVNNEPCSNCGGQQVDINYQLDVVELGFEGCLSCWTFAEVYPVYENISRDYDYNRDKLASKLVLLDDKQVLLLESIIHVLMS